MTSEIAAKIVFSIFINTTLALNLHHLAGFSTKNPRLAIISHENTKQVFFSKNPHLSKLLSIAGRLG